MRRAIYLCNVEKETITDVLEKEEYSDLNLTPSVLAISPDGQLLAIGKDNGSLLLINLRTKTNQTLIPKKEQHWLSLSFSKDGTFLAVVNTNNHQNSKIGVWNLKQNKLLHHIQRKGLSIAKFRPNNYDLVIANSGENSYVELFNIMSGKQKQTFLQKTKQE